MRPFFCWWLVAATALRNRRFLVRNATLPSYGAGSLCGGSVLTLSAPARLCPCSGIANATAAASPLAVKVGLAPCALAAPPVCAGLQCSLVCKTSSLAATETTIVDVNVSLNGQSAAIGKFMYSKNMTPIIESFGPTAGQGGDMLHVVGYGLQGSELRIGDNLLTKRFGDGLMAQAVVPLLPPGEKALTVHSPYGDACALEGSPPLTFNALVNVQSVEHGRGGMGGGGELTVVGQGLKGAAAKVCESPCVVQSITPEPRSVHAGDKASLPVEPAVHCDLTVEAAGQTVVFRDAWEFVRELTPTVRSTELDADNVLTVNGDGLVGATSITVAGTKCTTRIVRDDYLKCELPKAGPKEGKVEVFVFKKGYALPVHSGADILTRPTVPPRVVGVGELKPFSAFTSTLCRPDLVSTDCPPGWACCGIQELEKGFGRCAVSCTISKGTFLSRKSLLPVTTAPPLIPPPPRPAGRRIFLPWGARFGLSSSPLYFQGACSSQPF